MTAMRVVVLSLVAVISGVFSACGDGSGDGAGGSVEGADYQPVDSSTRVEGERNFATLMARYRRGVPSRGGWAGYWWPYSRDGTSSAGAKYERATSRRGVVAWEQSHHGSATPGVESWWGHCNGWAAASVLVREPEVPVESRGVSFSVGDQKALYSELGMEVDADFFGQRNSDDQTSSASFRDVPPNQFLLVLTNYVGRGFPLVMDRYTGLQVWNHPIAGYQIAAITPDDDLGAHPDFENVYRVQVTMKIWWIRADVPPSHQTEVFAFADGPSYESRTLRAEVWLDAPLRFSGGRLASSGDVILVQRSGVAIGGTWLASGLSLLNSHPDYLWVPLRFRESSGYSNPAVDLATVRALFGN